MLEELTLILESIGDLTGIALWIVGAFISYKLIVYLSTAGAAVFVCKLLIERLYSWATTPKQPTPPTLDPFNNEVTHICISSDGTYTKVKELLQRVAGKRTGIDSNYIHRCSAEWLQEAIDEKENQ